MRRAKQIAAQRKRDAKKLHSTLKAQKKALRLARREARNAE